MTDASTNSLLQELASLRGYIAAARAIIKDGHMPDMRSFEGRIADVCENIQVSGLDMQRQCLPELAALLKALDECERDMRAWHVSQKKSESL